MSSPLSYPGRRRLYLRLSPDTSCSPQDAEHYFLFLPFTSQSFPPVPHPPPSSVNHQTNFFVPQTSTIRLTRSPYITPPIPQPVFSPPATPLSFTRVIHIMPQQRFPFQFPERRCVTYFCSARHPPPIYLPILSRLSLFPPPPPNNHHSPFPFFAINGPLTNDPLSLQTPCLFESFRPCSLSRPDLFFVASFALHSPTESR